MKKEISLLIDSHHGIYSGQILATQYGNHLQVSQEDKDILTAGPDHEYYIETWADMEGETMIDDTGERYFIWTNEGDTWAVPDGWEWSEDEETYIDPVNLQNSGK